MRIALSVFLLMLAAGTLQADDDDRFRLGAQFAFGVEQGNLFGSGDSSHTQLLMFQPQVSVALLVRDGEPFIELVNEVTLANSLKPYRNRLIMSVNEGFRFHVWTGNRFGGYLEFGAGIGSSQLYVDPDDPTPRDNPVFRQLNGRMQYHLQLGGGLRFTIGAHRLQVGYRLSHFSNNNTQLPNPGLNLNTILVSWHVPIF